MEKDADGHLIHENFSLGERAADTIARVGGSWTFIITFLVFLAIWIGLNIYAWIGEWDPYPFILLNLVLSTLAALQAPVILMSQNRLAKKDTRRSQYDYNVDLKSEKLVEEILERVKKIESKVTSKV